MLAADGCCIYLLEEVAATVDNDAGVREPQGLRRGLLTQRILTSSPKAQNI